MARHKTADYSIWLLSGAAIAAFSLVAHAQTQSASPFAKRGAVQAWETDTATQVPAQSNGRLSLPQSAPTGAPSSQYNAQPNSAQPNSAQPTGATYGTYTAPTQPSAGTTYQYSDPQYTAPTGSSYSQDDTLAGAAPTVTYTPPQTYGSAPVGSYSQFPEYTRKTGAAPVYTGPSPAHAAGASKTLTWQTRLAQSNTPIVLTLRGLLRLGAAATSRNGDWDADFIADGQVRTEASLITQSGIEYGAGVKLRGQYDKFRRGFGGRVGDCPPTLAGCAQVDVNGTPTAIRGHTTQFYTAGPSNAQDFEFAVEGAYLFLRSAYGDVTVGRDDGAAYLFSIGAPTLLAVGASNSPVDYTGLDSVKTINDASGFAEKVTYTSPRLLGDRIGVGVQFGASYSTDAFACGTNYCVRKNGVDGTGVLSPQLEDVIEGGISLDRTFDNGLSVEATATYATATETSGLGAFDDLQSLGLGAQLGYGTWKLGGSYLQSNNGLQNGDYTAYDVGVTWQPNKLGFTLGYGHAEDENISLTSDQAVFGVSYDWTDNVRIGTGVQYATRNVPIQDNGSIVSGEEDATSIFIEGRVTF